MGNSARVRKNAPGARAAREKAMDEITFRGDKYRPKSGKPSKGLLLQSERVIRQQWTSQMNEEFYQNGREWMMR